MTSTILGPQIVAPKLSDKQLNSIKESTARVNIWEGSIRSGKTIASILRFLIAIALAPHGGEIVISGRTRESIFRNVIAPMQNPDLFGSVSKRVIYNQGAPTGKILGRVVHVIGASDAKAEAVVRGMTVLLWYCDEITIHPESFVTQMFGRMSPPGAQAFMTTNPDSPRHWFKVKYLNRAKELGWKTWHFVLDDNPSLEESYVKSIKLEFTGMWYDRYILGLWKMAEGAIWDSYDETFHSADSLPAGVRILRRVVGIDYGTTNATAAILLGLGSDGNLYVLSEWRHDSRKGQAKWTDALLSKGIRRWLTKLSREELGENARIIDYVEWIAVDPSAASFRLQLFNDGLSNVTKADNSVVDGIRKVSSLFSLDRLTIIDAPALKDEIPGYVWDEKKVEKGEDAPVKLDDHSCDGLRYAVSMGLALWNRQIGLTNAAA